MACNFLQLNDSKTEVIIFGPPSSVTSLSSALGPLSYNVHPVVRNLGIMLDSSLNFNKQINSVVEGVLLSRSDLEILMHAFISSRLDHCNILYTGLTQSNIHKLQMVQNAAARMLTGTKKREHITPVLAQLHWLPVKFKIDLLFVKLLMAQPPLILLKCFPHTPPPGRPGHPQKSSYLSPVHVLKRKVTGHSLLLAQTFGIPFHPTSSLLPPLPV